MATLNDHKLIKNISKNYFEGLNSDLEIEDDKKSLLGFYVFILSCITGETDIEELKKYIVDTEFRKLIFNEGNNDLGIDAYYLDEEKKQIYLFNFKYRKKFNVESSQKIVMVSDSSKFFNAVKTENTEDINTLTGELINKIIEKQNSTDLWEVNLFLVSNENNKIDMTRNEVSSFEKSFDVKIIPIVLDDIVNFVSSSPKDKKATFLIASDSVLTYKNSNLSSSQSYLVKMSLIDLLRITCESDEMKKNYSIEDYKNLENQKLDVSLLYDNVRGYLGDTKFNKNIVNTLENNPNKFFMFNNGITITTKNINADIKNGGKRFKCTLDGFQIVNGGQTLRSIYKFKDEKFDENALATAEILVRIFQTAEDGELTNDIAEFTNSQNAISTVDLKSISNIQIKIEEYFKSKDIDYIRKIDKVAKKSIRSITMERMAQILYSKMGYPERVTSQKSNLFTKYYDQIFNDNLNFDDLIELFNLYTKIIQTYNKTEYDFSAQKSFYIVWLVTNFDVDIVKAIKIFETLLKEYKTEESLSDARKVIQKGFKDHLLSKINGGNNLETILEGIDIQKSHIAITNPNLNTNSKEEAETYVIPNEFSLMKTETVPEYFNRVFKFLDERGFVFGEYSGKRNHKYLSFASSEGMTNPKKFIKNNGESFYYESNLSRSAAPTILKKIYIQGTKKSDN